MQAIKSAAQSFQHSAGGIGPASSGGSLNGEIFKQLFLMVSVFTTSIVALVAIELDQVPWQIQWLGSYALSNEVLGALDNLLMESLVLFFVAASFAVLKLSGMQELQYQSLIRDPDQFHEWKSTDLTLLEHRVDRFIPLPDFDVQPDAYSAQSATANDNAFIHGDVHTRVESEPGVASLAVQLEIALKEIDRLRCERNSFQRQLDQANQEIERMASSRQSDYLLMNVSRLPIRRVAGVTDPSSTLNRRQFDPVQHPHKNQK